MSPSPNLPALHDRLTWRVARVARILQSQLEERLTRHGLTRMSWLVLRGLGDDGVTSPSALAAYIGITRPATSRLLARMEASGLVARSGADGDGRSVALLLTERGRHLLSEVRPEVDAHLARFRAKLDDATYGALMDGLARLAADEDGDFTSL